MAFLSLATSFVLSMLLCTSLTANADATLASYPPPADAPHSPPPQHHHHHHPPAPAPSSPPAHPPFNPPSHSPVKPPAHPPVKPPSHSPAAKPPAHPPMKPPRYPPMRKKVAIQGVVYCKTCKYRGVDTLVAAGPLAGAVVKLQCNNSKTSLVEEKTTDKNGYFFFMPQKLTTSGSHKCKVFLISSPKDACKDPTNLHGGAAGAILLRKPPVDTPPKPLPFELFTVGPFAFDPTEDLCRF